MLAATAVSVPFPSVTTVERQDCRDTSSSAQHRAITTPTGCRLTKATVFSAMRPAVTAVSLAALAPVFAVSRARLAYSRFCFCFCQKRERMFFLSSGCSRACFCISYPALARMSRRSQRRTRRAGACRIRRRIALAPVRPMPSPASSTR